MDRSGAKHAVAGLGTYNRHYSRATNRYARRMKTIGHGVLCFALANGPGACRRAAGAWKRPHILIEVVVDGKLFARFDGAQAHIKDMALLDAANQIGTAAMVDDLGSAAVDRAIQRPIRIYGE